jgi:VCBS repeat-containing protein
VSFGSDADGDALSAAITAQPAHGTLERQPDGRYRYTPQADFNGTDSLRFTLSDGELVSNEATLTLQVAAVNDAPVAVDQTLTLDEDTTLTIDPLQGASDVDGDPLVAAIVTAPAHGALTVDADGSFTYKPEADYNGADSFTFRVNDGQADSDIATVSLTVRPVNDAPVASDVAVTVAEGDSLRFDPLQGASDVDGDRLTATVVQEPAHGTLTVNADGSFSYTPAVDFFGSDSFSYRVSDGVADSGLASFYFDVTRADRAPTATGGLVTGMEDTPLVLTWDSLGVSNAEGDALTFTLMALPADGELQVLDAQGTWVAAQLGQTLARTQFDTGGVRFVPAANASGGPGYAHEGYGNRMTHYARIGYTVSDSQGTSAEATLTIDITAVADTPQLQPQGSDTGKVARTWWQLPGATRTADGKVSRTWWRLPESSKTTDEVVSLQDLGAKLVDQDGSETLMLTMTGMPVGSVLSDGTHSFTATDEQLVADVTGWDFAKLNVRPPAGFSGRLILQVQATAIETSNGSRATATDALEVNPTDGALGQAWWQLGAPTELAALEVGNETAVPVSANPFVTTTVTDAGVGNLVLAPSEIVVGAPVLTQTGTLQFTVAPSTVTGRSWEEEEAEDRSRAQAMGETWLRELEQAAQAQWSALMKP